MKLLVIGAGSAGRRHARHASALAETGVFDTEPACARDAAGVSGARLFASLDEALAWGPDGAVVATPHACHAAVAGRAVEAGIPVLVEKPIAPSEGEAVELLERAAAAGVAVHVVCNMRFHPGPARLRRHIRTVGRPLFAQAWFGHYLPNMRPGVDYRTLYCARAARGGGVVLDGVHEIDYLTWLLGPVEVCSGRTARLSELDIDVEDYAVLSLTHAGGARSEIQLDYLRQCKRRGCEIVGTKGALLWQSEGKAPERCAVRLHRRGADSWETLFESDALDTDAPYRILMERFAAAVAGDAAAELAGGRAGLETLRVALGARGERRLR